MKLSKIISVKYALLMGIGAGYVFLLSLFTIINYTDLEIAETFGLVALCSLSMSCFLLAADPYRKKSM
jgi:hypothetical protein